MNIALKPLLVVTGTLHVEGGEQSRVRKNTVKSDSHTQTRIVDRKVDKPRRDANVIVVDYGRRLKERVALLRTPFGVLVSMEKQQDLRDLINDSTRKIAEWRRLYPNSTTRLANHVLVETLAGIRQASVTSWVLQQKREKDEAVLAVFDQLVRLQAV